MLNYARQFIKIRVIFYTTRVISETKTVTPCAFCISGTSNSLSDCSKNFKKIYGVENFRANVLQLNCKFEFRLSCKQRLTFHQGAINDNKFMSVDANQFFVCAEIQQIVCCR